MWLKSACKATLLILMMSAKTVFAANITGAGASFPYPIYAKWAEEYKKKNDIQINYQSIGSGAGIKQIKAKIVDFGASDMPLTIEELNKNDLFQFPAIMGGVVPVVNVAGVAPGQIRLTGITLADIYMGKITKWNAPEIAMLNPNIKLPNADITVVYRADGSGTSFVFTNYLAKNSAEFKTHIGVGTTVKWPVGIGGKGNEGVAANVQKIKGSIGYVEYAYAKKNKLQHTQLKNPDGNWVAPDDATFKAAANAANWANTPGFAVEFTNAAGANSWPITSASFILLHKKQDNAQKGKQVLAFFEWAYKQGEQFTGELDYVAIPVDVVKLVEHAWKAELKDNTGKAIWP